MILIAIGANLPAPDGTPPLATCKASVERILSATGLRLGVVSRWYESAPVPPSGQPPYINGVVRLDGDIDPVLLLRQLQEIEARAGRARGNVNAARTLDLDIVAIVDRIRAAPDPILPHPRAHMRAFVLRPLADVAPGWLHPVLHQTVEALLAAIPSPDIRPIA